MATNYLNLSTLHGLGHADFNITSSSKKDQPGRYAFLVDSFGFKIFHYGRNISGSAQAQGELVSRCADVAASNITSGTTTSATKAATWTANEEEGKMLYVTDNDDSAGAAPEGEVSIVSAGNSAATVNVDPNYPYSAALAANDDLDTISPGWHFIDAASGDKAQEVKGVVIPEAGFADNDYGWVQCYGVVPKALIKASTGLTDRSALIADAARVAPDANGGWELTIGYGLGTVTSDIVADTGVIFINVFGPTLNAGTP